MEWYCADNNNYSKSMVNKTRHRLILQITLHMYLYKHYTKLKYNNIRYKIKWGARKREIARSNANLQYASPVQNPHHIGFPFGFRDNSRYPPSGNSGQCSKLQYK